MTTCLNISSQVLFPLFGQVETPLSRRVQQMFARDDWAGILSISVDPRNYDDALSYYRDALVTSLLRKNSRPVAGIDRSARAVEKWRAGEAMCYRTNERLSPFLYGSHPVEDEGIFDFVSEVRKRIASWVGHAPPSIENIEGRFGPGSTFSDRGRLTTIPDKITSQPTLTSGATTFIWPWLRNAWGRAFLGRPPSQREIVTVRGNRFTTVPKTGLIDRAIAIEPAVNIFYQLGYGSAIRQRLKRFAGWDLTRAQEKHRKMALSASVTKAYCTIDLSNASDTVSYNLVKLLLPTQWFEVLDNLRSPNTLLQGKWHRLEKFSSMGNGFTFELESLIFAALMSVLLMKNGRSGCLGEDLFVFGDDIILPDDLYSEAVSTLRYFGFEINQEKSFHGADKFRESCGGDFFEGADVRPCFIKDEISDPWALVPQRNSMSLALKKLSLLDGQDHTAGLYGIDSVLPTSVLRCRGPSELGDSVIHDDDESAWKIKWKDGIRYLRSVKTVGSLLQWHHWTPDVVLACALYGAGDGRLGILPRDPVLSYKCGWVPFS